MGWQIVKKKIKLIQQVASRVQAFARRATIFLDQDTDLISARKSDGRLVILEGGESGSSYSVTLDGQAAGTVVIGALPEGAQPYDIVSISSDIAVDAADPNYKYVITEEDGTNSLGDITTATDAADLAATPVIDEELANLLTTTTDQKYLAITIAAGTVSGTIDIKVKYNIP